MEKIIPKSEEKEITIKFEGDEIEILKSISMRNVTIPEIFSEDVSDKVNCDSVKNFLDKLREIVV